ncbi:MAG: hypothetical protein ACTTKH_03125 [Treponema sp.]
MKNIKNLFLCLIFLILAFACNGNGNKGRDPKLVLISLKIHSESVAMTTKPESTIANGNVTIGTTKETVGAENIIASFKYGDVTDIIPVTVVNGPISFEAGQKKRVTLKINSVAGQYRKWTANINIEREKDIFTDHLSGIEVYGGRNKGVQQHLEFEGEDIISILKGEPKTIEIIGDSATVYLLSRNSKYSEVKVNGQSISPTYNSAYKSIARFTRKLTSDTDDVTFTITADGNISKGKLIFNKKSGKFDIPDLALYMKNKKQNTYSLIQANDGGDMFEALAGSGLTIGDLNNFLNNNNEATIVVAAKAKDIIKEVKIDDGTPVTTVKEKTIGNERFGSLVECDVNVPSTKTITVTITPKDENQYHTAVWKIILQR